MITIGYYPGCSLRGSAKEFDRSLLKTANVLGIELKEIDDWNCCGATSAHATNHLLSIALPIINLNKASKQGIKKVLAPCAACYNRLVMAKHEITKNEDTRKKVEELIEEKISMDVEVINIVQFITEYAIESLKTNKKISLDKLKVGCYYGCLLLRPNDAPNFDDPEDPSKMEEIVKITGAEPVKWNFRTECCGASHSIPHKDIAVDLSKKIIDDATKHGAEMIVVGCPMCHSNLDMRQLEMKKYAEYKNMPILYLTELIGLSLGITPDELGVNLHFIESKNLLEKYLNKVEAAV
jgi:heterodisulfide reductase subunit B2